jgi:hypothetical protein
MSSEADKAPIMILLAVACLAGAGVLAWFSSPVTMTLTRASGGSVVVLLEARLFNLFTRTTVRIENVKSVSTITFQGPGKFSDTPNRIVFDTPSGPVDSGMIQQLFVRDFAEIKAFLEGPRQTSGEGGDGDGQPSLERDAAALPRTLSLSSIAVGSELRRFAFAQLAVAFLTFLGLGVGYMGAKAMVA